MSCHEIPFAESMDGEDAAEIERERVNLILGEADFDGYYASVAKEGNRKSHYTGPVLGATLAHPLPLSFTKVEGTSAHSPKRGLKKRGVQELNDRAELNRLIREFRVEVDKLLPRETYFWFDDSSLHITLRALIL